MTPLHLSLTNFLSYRETADLDFTGLHLACISGLNGAGKSTILDAITWALFGQSRSRSDDDVVNRLAARADETAEVILDFELEGVVYRIMRRKRAGRAMAVEFLVAVNYEAEEWKALTGSGRRETDSEIVRLLRMNHDTFSNASFLLQGRADEFTTKTPGRRKEVLADLLGVNLWDHYREAAAGRRKAAENQVSLLDAQIGEIELELAQEPARIQALTEAKGAYQLMAERLAAQEQVLEQARRAAEALAQQRLAVAQAAANLEREEKRLAEWQDRHRAQTAERAAAARLLADEEAILARHAAWQTAQAAAEAHQARADEQNRIERAIRPHEVAVAREKSALEEKVRALRLQKQRQASRETDRAQTVQELAQVEQELARLDAELASLAAAQEIANRLAQERSGLEGEKEPLRQQMDELLARIQQLEDTTGGRCPLCGQPLTEKHRVEVVADLQREGKDRGDRFRVIKTRLPEIDGELRRLENDLARRASLEKARESQRQKRSRLQAALQEIEDSARDWAEKGSLELASLQERLANDEILPEAQAALAGLVAEREAVGYEPAAHQEALAARDAHRDAPQEWQALEQARSKEAMLATALANLEEEIRHQETVVADLSRQRTAAQETLDRLGGDGDDLPALERSVHALRAETVDANRRVAQAEARLTVLDDQRARREKLDRERAQTTVHIQRLRRLEQACGRDGVQALLIEQSLPEIEDAANRLLNRLTDGQMQVTFETQKQLKSREGLAETLDIHIADGAGIRPYENYSGGEQFRVNFAIRIALSQILAQRAGARLQTLVIDEGFGSQDPTGRQRLVEAINAIRDDFKIILVITHIDELRDAFPNRIDVVKTPRGSQVTIV